MSLRQIRSSGTAESALKDCWQTRDTQRNQLPLYFNRYGNLRKSFRRCEKEGRTENLSPDQPTEGDNEHPKRIKRITAPELSARKGEPIAVLTAYTAPMAQFVDEHVDCLLVGDSLGMVVYGLDTTLAVTLDMMINHGAAVVRGSNRTCVIVDMPFASIRIAGTGLSQCRPHDAGNRRRRGQAGGGVALAPTIEFLAQRGIQ